MEWLCGIDTIAHAETLKVKGRTIAVLGTGFNNIYPEENIRIISRHNRKWGTCLNRI